MNKNQQKYIEDFGLFFDQIGLGQTSGRIMGWLLICEPPHQTLDDICESLSMSKSTISTTIRLMQQYGMVERISIHGDRKHYYQVRTGFWLEAIEKSMQQFHGFKSLAEQGLEIIQDQPDDQKERLHNIHKLYSFLQREFPAMLDKWRTETEKDEQK